MIRQYIVGSILFFAAFTGLVKAYDETNLPSIECLNAQYMIYIYCYETTEPDPDLCANLKVYRDWKCSIKA